MIAFIRNGWAVWGKNMIDEKVIIGIITAIIAVPILGYATGAIWSTTDQIVDMSDNQQLQKSYQVGKTTIQTAETVEDVKDNFAFSKSILGLALIIGVPATIIKAIKG